MKYRIKEILEQKGMTIAELARKLKMNQSYITGIANGKVAVSNYRLAEIAEALGVQFNEIFDDEIYHKTKMKMMMIETSIEIEESVSEKDLQGNWQSQAFGTYHNLTFTGNEYAFYKADVKNKDITHVEYGTFKIDAVTIKFTPLEGQSRIGGTGDCKIYWENPDKTQLHLWPAGSFTKSK